MARIDFLVCHLSGTGHLVRTLTLAETAKSRGHGVRVISGGRPLAHLPSQRVEIVQLPWVAVRGLDFSMLRGPDGTPASDAHMSARIAAIETALADRPDALVTETWPFGRRALAHEYEAAVAAVPGALLYCSVRDIPEPKPKRIGEVAHRLEGFDGVLVHGDKQVVPLSESWPLPGSLDPIIHHAGYIGRRVPAAARCEEIIVSIGGGTLGDALLSLAHAAAGISDRTWRILVGGADAEARLSALGPAGATTVVETVRADFPALLAGAAASVSLAGYNTCVELLQTTTPALLIPSEEGGESEQTIRAEALARLPGIEVASAERLDSSTLARQAEALASGPRRPRSSIKVDRGERAIAILEAALEEKA